MTTINRSIDYATLIAQIARYDCEWKDRELHITNGEEIELEDGTTEKVVIAIYRNIPKKDLKAKIKYLLEKIK